MRAFLAGQVRRFINTCLWSLQGWIAAWATEMSLRQWTVVNILSATLAFALPMTTAERALILGFGLLILAAELFNTAIEEIMDFTSPAEHPAARKAKDCGSAAVALVAIAGGVVWLVVLFGR
ncbi:MAG: diacylglycerol kinase [Proteobacteria bacterium]|nr:diacylglycerol kinase [Pseudomonadota bacterium]MBS0572730.1 diacylglycerol kinase [Pseudomonadota bacterium]